MSTCRLSECPQGWRHGQWSSVRSPFKEAHLQKNSLADRIKVLLTVQSPLWQEVHTSCGGRWGQGGIALFHDCLARGTENHSSLLQCLEKPKYFSGKFWPNSWQYMKWPLPEKHESIYRMFFLTGPPYFFTNRHLANHSCCSMNFFIERGHLVCIEKGVGAVKTPYRICVKSEYVPADKSLREVVLVDLKSKMSAFSLSLSKFPILGLQSPYKQNFHFHCLNYLSWACNHHINRISTFTF